MKNRLFIVVSIFIVFLIGTTSVNASENEVSFNIGVDKVYNGIKFPVYININNKEEDVSGILFNLKYDSDKLEALIDDNDYNTQYIGNDSASSILSTNEKDIVYAYNNSTGNLSYYSSLKESSDNKITIWFKPKQFSAQNLKITVSDFNLYKGANSSSTDNYVITKKLNVNSGIGISDVKINNKINKIYVGVSYKLNTTILPNDTELSKNVTWKSSNNSVLSVDDNGVILAKKPGTVTVTSKSLNGMVDTDTIIVTLGKTKFNSVSNIKEGVKLTWYPNNELDCFKIYRKKGNGKYKKIAKLKSNISEFIDTDVDNGSYYTYYIKGYDNKKESKYSTSQIYRIKRPNITKLSNKLSKSVKVEFKKNYYVDGYEIIYSTDSKLKKNVNKVKVKSYNMVYTYINKLKKGNTYYFKIRSYAKYKKVKYYSAWSSSKYIIVKK